MEHFVLSFVITFAKLIAKEIYVVIKRRIISRLKGRTAPKPRDGSD